MAIALGWCRDKASAQVLARFFHDNLTPSYISHSELQGPRAIAPGQWAPCAAHSIETELIERVSHPDDAPTNATTTLTGWLKDDGRNCAVFLVTFARTAPVPFAILEDLVVDRSLRGKGYGKQCLDWIYGECRRRGILRVFLESGVHNHRAHDLFNHEGFETISVVMMKELGR
jgi:GNAT superfamily N-acetyltransferase